MIPEPNRYAEPLEMNMGLALRERSMPPPKQVGRPSKPSGPGRAVRIDPELVTMARRISESRGIPMSDYLSGLMRPGIQQDYLDMLRSLGEAPKGRKGRAQ